MEGAINDIQVLYFPLNLTKSLFFYYTKHYKFACLRCSGFISATELKEVLTTIGETLSADEIKSLMDAADTDGDGQISYKEFIKLFTSSDAPKKK